ncbi:hypothetical protein [Streptococcus pluranimalium]|uniref:hypothetical protein n=1 Tax=Streptococcus pluranimalium TaxID=82348 RepID=UPI0039FD7D90
MSKFLTVKDFDLTQIGRRFEVQEVRDYVDRDTGEILGHYYDCKILDGDHKKKWVTVRVDHYSRQVTNDDIVSFEQVIVSFSGLELSSIQPRRQEGLRVFYSANEMIVEKFVSEV